MMMPRTVRNWCQQRVWGMGLAPYSEAQPAGLRRGVFPHGSPKNLVKTDYCRDHRAVGSHPSVGREVFVCLNRLIFFLKNGFWLVPEAAVRLMRVSFAC
jgi:hypothetical protein